MAGTGWRSCPGAGFAFAPPRPPFRAKLGGDGITARIFPYYVFAGHTRAAPDSMATSSTQAVPETRDTPQHVAIIMDGNGRWATRRLLPHGGTRQGRAGRPARGRGLRARRRALPDAVRVQLRELAASRRRGLPADAAVRPGAGARGRQARRAGRAAARDRRSRPSSRGCRNSFSRRSNAPPTTTACISPWRPITADAGTSCRPRAPCWRPNPIWPRTRNGSMRRICRATCRCPGRPSRTCSSAPAENNAFPIS